MDFQLWFKRDKSKWHVKNTYTGFWVNLQNVGVMIFELINPLTPNDHYSGRTAPLTSKRFILYTYSTYIGIEYFKHGIYSPFFF